MAKSRIPKKTSRKKPKIKSYRIYGIFNFKNKKLLYVNIDLDQTELEFGLGDYDEKICDVISFEVILV
jgi:hypothetical protein